MTMTDDELVVRASVAAVAQLPSESVQRLGDARTFGLLAAATTEAVKRKFSTVPNAEQIHVFSSVLKDRFPDGADLINPIATEAVIKAAFGDDEGLESIGTEDLRALLFLLPYAIISDENLSGEPLDAFVAQVMIQADADE